MKKKIIFLFFIGFFFLKISYAQIVVFPFEDYTYGDMGINLEISEYFAKKLSQKNKIIFPREIIPILQKYRKVNFSQLDFLILREIYQKFNAEYILLGTIGKIKKEPPSISLTLRLIDIFSGKVIWSKSESFSAKDSISFLGLKKIDYDYMLEKVYTDLFSDFKIKKFRNPEIKILPEVNIQEIVFNSRYVKSDEVVECMINLVFSGSKPDFMGLETETKQGKRIVPLNPYLSETNYLAFWKAPEREGKYPVNLIIRWDKITKKIFIGNYYVDNTPPNITLVIRGARKRKGKIFAKDTLEIIPKVVGSGSKSSFIGRENGISKWEVEVFSKIKNKVILKQSYPGKLPTSLTWFVRKTGGLPPGEYIIKFRVWDLAGNENEVKKEVTLITDPVSPQITVYKGEKGVKSFIELIIEKNFIPLRRIDIDIYTETGVKVAEFKKEGKRITDKIEKQIFIDEQKLKKIEKLWYNAIIEDEMKNKRIIRRAYIPIEKIKGPAITKPTFETWIEEF